MAIALETLQAAGRGFINNATSADASGVEIIVAAVADKTHFITSITVACISAITVTIQDETGAKILGPVPFAATSSPITVNFLSAVKIAAVSGVEVETSGAGAVNVVIQGYTE